MLLLVSQFRINGQSQSFTRRTFCFRERRLLVPQIIEARLEMKRNWIIDLCSNRSLFQVLCGPITTFTNTNHILVKDVASIGSYKWWLTRKSKLASCNNLV